MHYNIVSYGKSPENLKLSLEKNIIGFFHRTVKDHIAKGNTVFLHCESKILGLATVNSNYFFNECPIWSDKTYPHRFEISNVKMFNSPVLLTNGVYNEQLRERFGKGWAYKFLFTPKPLPDDIGRAIESELFGGEIKV